MSSEQLPTARELLAAHAAAYAEWERNPARDIKDIPQRPVTTWRNCSVCRCTVYTCVDCTPLCAEHESAVAA